MKRTLLSILLAFSTTSVFAESDFLTFDKLSLKVGESMEEAKEENHDEEFDVKSYIQEEFGYGAEASFNVQGEYNHLMTVGFWKTPEIDNFIQQNWGAGYSYRMDMRYGSYFKNIDLNFRLSYSEKTSKVTFGEDMIGYDKESSIIPTPSMTFHTSERSNFEIYYVPKYNDKISPDTFFIRTGFKL